MEERYGLASGVIARPARRYASRLRAGWWHLQGRCVGRRARGHSRHRHRGLHRREGRELALTRAERNDPARLGARLAFVDPVGASAAGAETTRWPVYSREIVTLIRFWRYYREARQVGFTRYNAFRAAMAREDTRSEEHTPELQP